MDYGHQEGGPRTVLTRKRRFRDSDEGNDRRPKRRHYEEPSHAKLRRKLLNLAEPISGQSREVIAEIAADVAGAAQDDQLQNTFLDTVVQLVVEQPLKIPFLAATATALNVENPDLTGQLVERVSETLTQRLLSGTWRDVKLLLRLLGCVQNVLGGDGVFPVLHDLFSRAADLQTASAEDTLGLEIVKIILFTLAYVMKYTERDQHESAMLILEKTAIIASTPHGLEALVRPFVTGEDKQNSANSQSLISLLQQQLQNEASCGWPLECLPSFANTQEHSRKHTLPSIIIPVTSISDIAPRLPELDLSVYADQEIETVPKEENVAASIFRDVLTDTVNTLDFNRNIAARSIIEVDSYFAKGIFVARSTPYDRLRETESGKSTWKGEDLAIDAVFSQLFALPRSEHKSVYYHSLLTEACKIAPTAVAPSLGRAIRFLYKNVGALDLEIAYRFNDWFSHHLSNFGFTWKWTEWVDDLELPLIHPRMAFITGTIDKEIRLSFPQRIRGTLPDPYLCLIPGSKDKDVPEFKYNPANAAYSQPAGDILRLIRQKGQDQEIQKHIETIEAEAFDKSSTEPALISTDVYVTCICFAGAKSLSHVLNCIERCKERLLVISSKSGAARRQIINSVMEYWKEKPGVGVTIVDKLLNYTILTPMTVIEWVVADHLGNGELLAETYVFELVSGTVDKVARRIRQIVAARKQCGLTRQQIDALETALNAESTQMKMLFSVLEDALRAISGGNENEAAETKFAGNLAPVTLHGWGRRWLKTFTRKLAVEQSWITDVMSRDLPGPNQMSDEPATSVDGKTENEQKDIPIIEA